MEDYHSVPHSSRPADHFETYEKRRGTTDFGREFEQIMCGYYAFMLATHDNVKDFEMTSNNAGDGRFDDIGLKITFNKSGKVRRFLFQLKHKKNKNVELHHLKAESNTSDFGVQKYIQSILKMNLSEDTICILSTNCSTNIKGTVQLMGGIIVEQCNHLEFRDFLINTEEGREDVIFEIKSENLKQKFYLFTSQMNVTKTDEKVNALWKNLLECDIHGSFANYMKHWWCGKFILTKHDVLAKVSELAFSPYLKTLTDEKCNEKSESLKQAIMNFPLTLVEDSGEGIVENIWKNEKSWTDEEFSKTKLKYGLKEHQINPILWHMGKVPLIVKADSSNERIIKRVIEFLKKNWRDKKIVLTGRVSTNDFKMNTLESLSNIIEKRNKKQYYSYIVQNFHVSLQGRGCITLEKLITTDADMAKLFGTRELLKMSQQEYLLVGKKKEKMSDFHIPRTISQLFSKTEDILNSYKSSQDTLIIVNCDENIVKKLPQNRGIKTMELTQYMSRASTEEPTNLIVLSTRSKCTNPQFETICKKSKKPNVSLFQHFDDGYCILVLSIGEKLKIESTNSTRAVKETEIFEYYNNPLHAFCAPTGMGKSTLMKILYNSCPPDCLAVYVSLINYNTFFADKPNNENIFNRFTQTDQTENDLFKQLKKLFWQKHKLYLFLDGLDEVNSQNIDIVLGFVKHALSKGVNVWVSSRENLRETICEELKAVPIEIKGLDKSEQETYINRRLQRQNYNNEEIGKIRTAVFNSTHLNNSQNLLGVPLQLYIITEMFRDRQIYENLETKNPFILTRMYETLFKGKIAYACEKHVGPHQKQQLGHQNLQCYELPALRAALDEEDCEKLRLNFGTHDVQTFLHDLHSEGDKRGIVKNVNENNQVVFEHQTYAEYFACVWFKKHPKKILSLRDKMFTRRYENLRLIFDIMMAEDHPLHLAVIYKDVDQLEAHIQDVDCEDEGGRTVFHLAFSYGQKYPVSLNSTFTFNETFKRETSCYVKIIKILLQYRKISKKKDELFELDCVSYALQSRCFYPIETMLEKKLLTFNELKERFSHIYDRKSLARYCAQFGYSNLLSELIRKARIPLELIRRARIPSIKTSREDEDLLELAVKGCDDDVYTPSQGNIEAVEMLLKRTNISSFTKQILLEDSGIEKRFDILKIFLKNKTKCFDGNTILHSLVKRCREKNCDEIMSIIREFNIDVNARNDGGVVALHLAAMSADLKIVQALLENGANLRILDFRDRNVLHYASLNSRLDVIKFFLDKNTEFHVNSQDRDGVTPLHLASQRGITDNVKILLDQGANPHLADYAKNNALHHTVDSRETMKLLISAGLDKNTRNADGLAPIHCAYLRADFNKTEFLSETGAKLQINEKFRGGATLLHMVCQNRFPHLRDSTQRTNLDWTEKNNRDKIVPRLLERGIDANIIDDDKKIGAQYYLDRNYEQDLVVPFTGKVQNLVHVMIDHGLNLTTRYKGGQTLLHIACLKCDTQTVRQLVERGVDVNAVDQKGRNALRVVLKSLEKMNNLVNVRLRYRNRFPEDIDIQHVHESNELQFGCDSCFNELVKSFKEKPTTTNFVDYVRNKLLMFVDNREMVDIFLKEVDASKTEDNKIASRFVIFTMINYLIKNGSDITKVNIFIKRPLIYPEITSRLSLNNKGVCNVRMSSKST